MSKDEPAVDATIVTSGGKLDIRCSVEQLDVLETAVRRPKDAWVEIETNEGMLAVRASSVTMVFRRSLSQVRVNPTAPFFSVKHVAAALGREHRSTARLIERLKGQGRLVMVGSRRIALCDENLDAIGLTDEQRSALRAAIEADG